MVLTDEHGIIRQSSVNEAIDQNASNLDYFRALANPVDYDTTLDSTGGGQRRGAQRRGDPMYIGPATVGGIMRLWHMNVARTLHHADGSFAGVIDAGYRISAITDIFKQTDLGIDSLQALVGLDDGKLRGVIGPATVGPNISIGETPMFAAVNKADHGIWIGPSPADAVRRIHAFRRIPGRNLAVIVAMDEDEAMGLSTIWERQAYFFAGCIIVLLLGLALALIQGTRLARRHETRLAEDRATLAASHAQFEVARALATAKAEQLEATLAGMSDGVAMIDAHMCLVEWNARFPEIAGVPPELLRVGLPMEEILRAQIRSGQFGPIQDPGDEVERRVALLKSGRFGIMQHQRPDGRTVELRRNRLPDGGFVTLYADITDQKRTEDTLLSTIRLLNDSVLANDSALAPAQQSLLTMASQSAGPSQSNQTDGSAATGQTQIASTRLSGSAPGAARPTILEPPRRRSPRTRVLVTEDVFVNRSVTATLLRREGHHVDVADSGQAAIEAVERHPYDLVFMDISMPGMSGQEATRIIRGLAEPARSVPIVALAGPVGADDAAAFRDDGIDDIPWKPASLPDLLMVLQTHVWAGRVTPGQAGAGSLHPDRSKATADDPDIAQPAATKAVLAQDRITELRTNLPPEIFLNLIEECLLDLDNQLPALRRALTAGAPAAVSVHAHAMRDTAAGHGMLALERRLRTITDAAHHGDLPSLSPSIVAELETDFNEAVQALREMLGRQVVR